MPAGTLPPGRVRHAPGRLGELLRDTTLSDALVEPTAIWLRLRDGLAWSQRGGEVQKALAEALADRDGWEISPAPGDVLERVTTDVLAGSLGEFVGSHGGSVVARRDGEDVEVHLGGACEHCPAAEYTLRLRLLDAMKRRCPDVVASGHGHGRLRLHLPPK